MKMGAGILAALLLAASTSLPAAFPERQIRFIVPFPPGGSTDVVARRVAAKAAELLGQPIFVDNVGGAGGQIGSDTVAKATPDGYTILLAQPGLVSNPALREEQPFDLERDLTPVAFLAGHPGFLVARSNAPFKTFIEFMKYVKAKPGTATYASAGVGSFPHLTMEMLKDVAKVDIVHVPYKGAGPAMIDLLGGRVDVKVDAYATSAPFLKGGKIVPLAVTGLKRIPEMPDLPTVAESGYPGFENSIWMGVMVSSKTPPDIVAKLEKTFIEAANSPEVVRALGEQGIYVDTKDGKAFGAMLKAELAKWRRIVKEAGIQPE